MFEEVYHTLTIKYTSSFKLAAKRPTTATIAIKANHEGFSSKALQTALMGLERHNRKFHNI
jgi:hypothetical protein